MNIRNGKYVYKDKLSMDKMHKFYDKALTSLQIDYADKYIDTAYGETHILIVGDERKPPVFTLHGGNGISPLNLKLFLPLLNKYYVIAPDVIGMPGKSAPYRNLNTRGDDFGIWISEIMNELNLEKSFFAVSSYSAAMMLSLAKIAPERIEKAMLLVPSGIAHGSIFLMISKMMIPFVKYYFKPSEKTLLSILETMVSESDDLWCEFFDLMMSSYKMEMRAPKEYSKKELGEFYAPIILFASNDDIFFPADKVFSMAKKIFTGNLQMHKIDGKHLPTERTMTVVCEKTVEFFENQ